MPRPEADHTRPFPIPGDDELAALATDRDLERLLDGEPDEEVTIVIEEEEDEPTSSATEVMRRPPSFHAHAPTPDDFPRPSVRVPPPGMARAALPLLFPNDDDESESHTLTGLHGLHDLIADDTQPILRPAASVAGPVLVPRSRTSTAKIPVAELPSVVVVDTSSSIAPLALDVVEGGPRVPHEIVLRSVLVSSSTSGFDDERSNATTVLPRPVARRRRTPVFGAVLGLAAALGIAATFALVMTWRTSTGTRRAAARGPVAATAVVAAVDAGH